jgi:hypothetical protein
MPMRDALSSELEMLYYYREATMPTQIHDHQHEHGHHHHHHPGEGHPPASISPSILRLSAIERLAAAGVMIALIWAAVLWAMAGS